MLIHDVYFLRLAHEQEARIGKTMWMVINISPTLKLQLLTLRITLKRKPTADDAEEIISFLNIVGGESDNPE